MKKVIATFLSLFCIVVLLFSINISYAESDTAVGKLVYYEYDAYPYVLELKNGQTVALEVDLDKKFRNKSVDKLLGKMVQVSGPARVITAMTELHGLKIIDIRPGKGNIKALR
jgi:hypothetical protein